MSREMKNSGIEWIGMIPTAWRIERLKWCLDEINVRNNPIQTQRVLSLTNKLGVVPYEEKGNQGNKAKEDCSEYKIAYENTLIVNSMNVIIGSVGISKYYGCVSPVYYVFRQNKFSDLRYINYIFHISGFQKELRKYAKGILEIRLRISSGDLFQRPIPLPSIDEQKKISDFLDTQCEKLDMIIEQTRASIEEYNKLKQAVITQAVTKGIRGKRPMKDSQNNRWGYIPEEWSFRRVKTCVTEIKSGLSAVTEDDTAEDSGFYVLRTSAVSTGVFIPTEVKPVLSTAIDRLICPIKKGVLIVSRMNTAAMVGMCAYVGDEYPNIFLPDKLWRIQVNESENAKFLWYSINAAPAHSWFGELATGASASMQNITISDFANNYIALPDKVEQDEIVDYLDRTCSEIDALIAKKEQYLVELENYKKSLIYEYVTGKKEVSNG